MVITIIFIQKSKKYSLTVKSERYFQIYLTLMLVEEYLALLTLCHIMVIIFMMHI